jgi:hypothetical protein
VNDDVDKRGFDPEDYRATARLKGRSDTTAAKDQHICPRCDTPGVEQKCKIVCPKCHTIILTCTEF